MRADGVIFDKDGTLFHFGATWASWAEAVLVRLCGDDAAYADRVAKVMGYDRDTGTFAPDSLVIAYTPEEIVVAMGEHIDMPLDELEAALNDEASKTPQAEAVPLGPFLDGLKAMGLKLGVATNDAEAPALAHLGGAGVLEKFDFVAGYDSGHGFKPEPGQCLGFATETGLDPARVVMVGDSLHDLHAGRAAGMQTVGVLTGIAGEAELAPHADVVLPNIGHLEAWLRG
ncbi:HAD family hydrolase [Aliiroseovarius sp.]|uniref:HAD family hydrolase n=1 Tax=Aliiroseovarius sp. TaxID=1872442 RepID=UPI003BAD889D